MNKAIHAILRYSVRMWENTSDIQDFQGIPQPFNLNIDR